MIEIFELFTHPFMLRALLAGVVLSVLLAYLGVFVVLRRMAFVSDGIAHASLAGIAIGLLAGILPLSVAILWSILFATVVYVLEKKTTIGSDSLIGILFTASISFGVLLMSFGEGFQPDLVSFLFGNILAISFADVALISVLAFGVLAFLATQEKKIALLSFNTDLAYLSGVNPNIYQLLFYILLAVSIVLGVKLVGVILVSALLIVPVSTAKLVARSFHGLVFGAIGISFVVVVAGLVLSAVFDLPTGPSIVLLHTGIFFLVFLFSALKSQVEGK